MIIQVAAVLFSPRSGCLCRELVMLRAKGLPAFVVPSTKIESRESPADAASRLIRSLGSEVAPTLWKVAGLVHTDSTAVMTAVVSAETIALLDEKKVYASSAELMLCDAWVNPRNYAADFIQMMALARAAHRTD